MSLSNSNPSIFQLCCKFDYVISILFCGKINLCYLWILFICLHCGFSQDTNENSKIVSFKINENTAVGTVIGDIRSQLSPKPSANVIYSISDSTYFRIDKNGKLIVNGLLDRDNDRKLCSTPDFPDLCIWIGLAIGTSNSPLLTLKITIEDLNDNIPTWVVAPVISIPENSPIKTTADFPLAIDKDGGSKGIDHYAIYPPNRFFTIENMRSKSGIVPKLVVQGHLDREEAAWHNLTVIAVDGGNPRQTGSSLVAVKVTDENDCTPKFNASVYSVTVDEDIAVGQTIPIPSIAVDCDEEGPFSRLRYKFSLATGERTRRDFSIDPNTGIIMVQTRLQYDAAQSGYEFQIVAEDGGSPPKSSEAVIQLQIRDRNNNAPEIRISRTKPSSTKGIEIQENLSPGQTVASVTVRDRDTGINGDFICTLANTESFQLTHTGKIESLSVYELHTSKSLDREANNDQHILIQCIDLGVPQQTSAKEISVKIIDVNDNKPRFENLSDNRRYSFKVSEGNEIGSPIGKVRATDLDEGINQDLIYSITWPAGQGSNPFTMNKRGEIIATEILDREAQPNGYLFTVVVKDSGIPTLNDSALVEVQLIDINDCPPTFSQLAYSFTLTEDFARNFSGPRAVGKVEVKDCDLGDNAKINFQIMPTGSLFSINDQGDIETTRLLDREKQAVYLIQILAIDSAQDIQQRKTSTASVTVSLKDVNDNVPQFIFPNSSSQQMRVSFREDTGFVITRLVGQDADQGDNAKLRYVITNGNLYRLFQLNPFSGELVVGEKMDYVHKGTISLTIKAIDGGHPPLTGVVGLNILVDDSPPIGYSRGDPSNPVEGLETNKLIIICIVVATGVICAVLITAISIMARRTPCFGQSSRRNDDELSPSKCMASQPLYGPPGALGDPGNGYVLTDRLAEYRMQHLGNNLDTFIAPAQTKLDETLDSDGDSGRGGSESNIRLSQIHAANAATSLLMTSSLQTHSPSSLPINTPLTLSLPITATSLAPCTSASLVQSGHQTRHYPMVGPLYPPAVPHHCVGNNSNHGGGPGSASSHNSSHSGVPQYYCNQQAQSGAPHDGNSSVSSTAGSGTFGVAMPTSRADDNGIWQGRASRTSDLPMMPFIRSGPSSSCSASPNGSVVAGTSTGTHHGTHGTRRPPAGHPPVIYEGNTTSLV